LLDNDISCLFHIWTYFIRNLVSHFVILCAVRQLVSSAHINFIDNSDCSWNQLIEYVFMCVAVRLVRVFCLVMLMAPLFGIFSRTKELAKRKWVLVIIN